MRVVKHMAGEMLGIVKRLWPLAFVALFAEWGYAIMNIGALPIYLSEPRPLGLGASVTLVGFIITTFLVVETLFKAYFGYNGDRHGRKPFIIGGLILSGITPLFMHLLDNPWLFFPLRAIDGIGAAALWPCIFATVASITTSEERVNAMSVFNMMYMIGLALALPSYSLVIRLMGDHNDVFLIISGAFMIGAVIAALAVPGTKDPMHKPEQDASGALAEPIGWHKTLRLASRSRVMMAMLIASFFQATGTNLLNGIIIIFANRRLGITPDIVGQIFIGPALAILVLALPLGWVGGRWGKVKSVRTGLVVTMIAMFLIPYTETVPNPLPVLSLIVVPLVIGFLIATPAWLALITEMAPPGRQGLIVGAVATAQGIGAMIGPALGGILYDLRPAMPFYAAGLFLLIALVITLREFREDMRVEIPSSVNSAL